MRNQLELLRSERNARVFLAAHLQSSLGTGAAYVALLVLAYERVHSPWAISLVLLADFLPAMVAGPLFGAAADRWSRRSCALVAECVRVVAFVGLALVPGFGALLLFALLAGSGARLFTPAVMAGLPGMVDKERLPAATSLYGAAADVGWTLGPVLGGLALTLASPEAVMLVNAITFAVSALAISRIDFGDAPDARGQARPSLFTAAREGIRATAGLRGVPTVVVSSSAVVLFAGMLNVGQLVLARDVLHAGDTGFALLVTVFGAGVIAGSLSGGRGGSPAQLKARYIAGLGCVGACMLGAGLAPAYPFALAAFVLGGLGNGLVLVNERLLLQDSVDASLLGRVFALKDTLSSWAFFVSFMSAGGLLAAVGARPVFVLAGVGGAIVCAATALALRGVWQERRAPLVAAPASVSS